MMLIHSWIIYFVSRYKNGKFVIFENGNDGKGLPSVSIDALQPGVQMHMGTGELNTAG